MDRLLQKFIEIFPEFKNNKKILKIRLTSAGIYIILPNVIEAWLSLVERCVRDAEVASSNLVASILYQ